MMCAQFNEFNFFFPNFGGVESHICYLSQSLLKLGHKVLFSS
jgi:phosphatidylinositol N-acetylglucosaminyltransferase subunit A